MTPHPDARDAEAAGSPATGLPVRPARPTRMARLKAKVVGTPLPTEHLAHERLGKPTALAVFASDNLSSSAYATEEILLVLATAGAVAFRYAVPVAVAITSCISQALRRQPDPPYRLPPPGEPG